MTDSPRAAAPTFPYPHRTVAEMDLVLERNRQTLAAVRLARERERVGLA